MTDDTENDVQQAIEPKDLLGVADEPNDWKLEPQAHAARLKSQAAALKRVLEHSIIREIMDRYQREDSTAGTHQTSYKRLGKLEVYLGTLAALLGAIVLSITDSANVTPISDGIRIALLIVQITCAASVAGIKYFAGQTKPYIKWQAARSAAETARVELFETVAGMTDRSWTDVQKDGDYPLLPLQLEYFVRYQLKVQLEYYDTRGKLHAAAAKRYVGAGAIITFVAALGAGFVGVANQFGDGVSIASMAALLAPILLVAQTSLSRLNQDERNAARYAITLGHLRKVQARLSDVRKNAVNNEAKPVQDFIRAADEVISVEHSEWITQQSENDSGNSASQPK